MRVRPMVLVLTFALMLILLLPASALASKSWVVRSTAGAKRGTVVLKSFGVGHCLTTKGSFAGTLTSGSGEPGGIVYSGSYTKPGNYLGSVDQRYYRNGADGNKIMGKAVRAGGRWLLKQKVGGSWRTRGRVSASCPSYMAATALRLLLWKK